MRHFRQVIVVQSRLIFLFFFLPASCMGLYTLGKYINLICIRGAVNLLSYQKVENHVRQEREKKDREKIAERCLKKFMYLRGHGAKINSLGYGRKFIILNLFLRAYLFMALFTFFVSVIYRKQLPAFDNALGKIDVHQIFFIAKLTHGIFHAEKYILLILPRHTKRFSTRNVSQIYVI